MGVAGKGERHPVGNLREDVGLVGEQDHRRGLKHLFQMLVLALQLYLGAFTSLDVMDRAHNSLDRAVVVQNKHHGIAHPMIGAILETEAQFNGEVCGMALGVFHGLSHRRLKPQEVPGMDFFGEVA